MAFNAQDAAIVITDPQKDFLSPDGVTWGLVGASVEANGTVGRIEQLFKAAKQNGYDVFISPHYYYPTDRGSQFGGTVENMMHEISMFDRKGALNVDGFSGSGADWLEQYKPYIEDGKTVVVSPHKVSSPRLSWPACPRISAAKATRELLEQGFDVSVVADATAAAIHPELGNGYESALTNFRFMASAVLTTDEAVSGMV